MRSKRIVSLILILTLLMTSVPVFGETDSEVLFNKLLVKASALIEDLNDLKLAYDIARGLKGQGLYARLETEINKDETVRQSLLNYGLTATEVEKHMDNVLDVIPSVDVITNRNSGNIFSKMFWEYMDTDTITYSLYASDVKAIARGLYDQLPYQVHDKVDELRGDVDSVTVYRTLTNAVLDDTIGSETYDVYTGLYTDRTFEILPSSKAKGVQALLDIIGTDKEDRVNELADAYFNLANIMVNAGETELREQGTFENAFVLAKKIGLIKTTTIDTTPETPDPPVVPVTPAAATPNVTFPGVGENGVELEIGTDAEVTTVQLNPTVSNSTATVLYEVEDDTVVSVSEDGLVTALSAGQTTITVTLEGSTFTTTLDVTVFLVDDENNPLGSLTFLEPYANGYTNGTFKPDNSITRAEVASMFAKILKYNTTATPVASFNDVSTDHWAYGSIQAIARHELFAGYTDGSFKPDAPITRAEIVTVFSNYWKLAEIEVDPSLIRKVSDVPTSHWALTYVNKGYNSGLISGYSDGTFRPDNNATRAELVVMINKLIDRNGIVPTQASFPDVPLTHWAFHAIEAAASLMVEQNDN